MPILNTIRIDIFTNLFFYLFCLSGVITLFLIIKTIVSLRKNIKSVSSWLVFGLLILVMSIMLFVIGMYKVWE
jgi:steroid 5-alpha reductase family enzyme